MGQTNRVGRGIEYTALDRPTVVYRIKQVGWEGVLCDEKTSLGIILYRPTVVYASWTQTNKQTNNAFIRGTCSVLSSTVERMVRDPTENRSKGQRVLLSVVAG